MNFIKFITQEELHEMTLEKNQYFASCVLGAERNIPKEDKLYMTKEQIYKAILCQTSDNNIYITKNPHKKMFNDYGLNCVVEVSEYELFNFNIIE